MGYSHEHRFKKRFGIHYTLKMNIDMVSHTCGIPVNVLQIIYNDEYEKTHRNSKAMNAVFSYCNGGRVFKEKHSSQNINE